MVYSGKPRPRVCILSYPCLAASPDLDRRVGTGRLDGLWQALEAVTDPRDRRGVRHRLPLLLALSVLAVTAGAKTFLEIAEHAADLPTELLTELGVCSWAGTPSGWTFARVLARVDHDKLDQALSSWTARHDQPNQTVAVDGKTMRAAITGHADMPRTQVVAAMNSRGEVLGQAAVHPGDENTAARGLLTRLRRKALSGTLITASCRAVFAPTRERASKTR